jgi:cytochrome c oxidase cbb3-type subunit 3
MRRFRYSFSRSNASITNLVAVSILLLVAGGARAQTPVEATKEQIAQGHKQFQQSCGFCHGADATGARGPDLVRSPLVAHDVKGELIGAVIRQGRPDKGMPAIEMSNEQVLDIAAYLRSRTQDAINSSGIPEGYPAAKLLTGNLEAGKTFFNGAGGCKDCHSATGDLAHVAGKFSPVDLEARMLYPDEEHAIAMVTLSSGEQVKGAVVHNDDFMIAVRNDSGRYRSFHRAEVRIEIQHPLAEHRKLLDKITKTQLHDLFAYVESLK